MTTHLSLAAVLLLAQAQVQALPVDQEPRAVVEEVLAAAPPAPYPRRRRDGRAEKEIGLAALLAGYSMGSLIFIVPSLPTRNGAEPVQHVGEKLLAFVPVAGPVMWWLTARERLGAREPIDCGFHYVLGLPYAVVATGAQAVGIGFLSYGILASRDAARSSAPPSLATLDVVPAPGGLSVQGTF